MSDFFIKIASPNDADKLLYIYSYYIKNTAVSFEYGIPMVEEFKLRIQNTLKDFPYIVAVASGEIVGYAYLSKYAVRAAYSWSATTSIYLNKNCKRKGYGKKLYSAIEEIAKLQNIQNLYACVTNPDKQDEYLTNDSELFHKHLGYQQVGKFNKCGYKFGKWYNIVWLEKTIGEHKQPIEKFIPFHDLDEKTLNNLLEKYKN